MPEKEAKPTDAVTEIFVWKPPSGARLRPIYYVEPLFPTAFASRSGAKLLPLLIQMRRDCEIHNIRPRFVIDADLLAELASCNLV